MTNFNESFAYKPVEVTTLEEAAFEDILDIGLVELARSDATVVGVITEPIYVEFKSEVEEFLALHSKNNLTTSKSLAEAVAQLNSFKAIYRFYKELSNQNLKLSRLREVSSSTEFDRGYKPGYNSRKNYHRPHRDFAVVGSMSVTINATLFLKNPDQKWSWGLHGDVMKHDSIKPIEHDFKAPLQPGGWVLLGENSREDGGRSCSVVHEVLSPKSSWENSEPERARLLLY